MTQTSKERRRLRALSACSHVVQLARVGVRVIVLVVDVVLSHACPQCSCCLFMLYSYSFFVASFL